MSSPSLGLGAVAPVGRHLPSHHRSMVMECADSMDGPASTRTRSVATTVESLTLPMWRNAAITADGINFCHLNCC